ncbi:MAG: GYD domain-containing protein [Betaproteobacteria bacterium]|nr:GYD domain-containing protein [Betaproteobacteria bacterium]
MSTFISLLSFTDQGIRNIKDSPKRAEAFKEMANKLGVKVKAIYWTLGHYDLVIVMDGKDEAVTSALLKAGSLGNIRSETLRAFSEAEIGPIIGNAS